MIRNIVLRICKLSSLNLLIAVAEHEQSPENSNGFSNQFLEYIFLFIYIVYRVYMYVYMYII